MEKVVQRFEKKGLKIVGLKFVQLDRKTAEKHYEEHIGKPFFEDLVGFITSGPIVAMAIEGVNAVETIRKMMAQRILKMRKMVQLGLIWL